MMGEPRTEYIDEVMHALPAPPAPQPHLPLDSGPPGPVDVPLPTAGVAPPGDADSQEAASAQVKLGVLNGQVAATTIDSVPVLVRQRPPLPVAITLFCRPPWYFPWYPEFMPKNAPPVFGVGGTCT